MFRCGTVQILQVWVWDCAGIGMGVCRYPALVRRDMGMRHV